ncbi:MAG: hypothetical protein ACLGJB_11700 [Blastocatellia bacterium]
MKKNPLSLLLAILAVALGYSSASGQNCDNLRTLPEYADCEVRRLVRERLMQSDETRQVEPSSASENSTTLVNRASAPDTVGITLVPNALATKSRATKSTDISSTISLYALYCLVTGRNPYDENLYNGTSNYRRFSFTLGRSYPEGKMAVPAQGSYTYQGKFLLSRSRDVGDPSNRDLIGRLVDDLKSGTLSDYLNIYAGIQSYLHGRFGSGKSLLDFIAETRDKDIFPTMVSQFTDEDRKLIQGIIEERIQSQVALQRKADALIKEITLRPQFSVSFTMRKSKGIGSNLYRSELILDKKFSAKLSSTLNMSYDFQDALSSTGVNRHLARGVAQIQALVGKGTWLPAKKPLAVAVSGDGSWGSNGTPLYKAQLKVTIPIIAGLNIPLSFTYANRTSAPLADIKGQMAITADIGKMSKAFATR